MSLFARDHERALRAPKSGRITTKTGEAAPAGRQKSWKVVQTPHFIGPDGSANGDRSECAELGMFGCPELGGEAAIEAQGPSTAGDAAVRPEGRGGSKRCMMSMAMGRGP